MATVKQILKLATLFFKVAQTLSEELSPDTPLTEEEQTAFTNHIIRINKDAQELYKYIDSMATNRLATNDGRFYADAKPAANNLKTYSIQLTSANQNNQTATNMRSIYDRILQAYNDISNNYLKPMWVEQTDYKPMKEIQQSLVYVDRFLTKKQTAESAENNVTNI